MDNPSEIESTPVSKTELEGFDKFAAEHSSEFANHPLSYREFAEYMGLKELVSQLIGERLYRAYEVTVLREKLDSYPNSEIQTLRGFVEKLTIENQNLRDQLRVAVEYSEELSERSRGMNLKNDTCFPYIS